MPRIANFGDLPEQARPTVAGLMTNDLARLDTGWGFDYQFELAAISGHEQVRIGDQVLWAPRVAELMELRNNGALLPPIVVDKTGYLIDGKHRVAVALKRRETTIHAVVLDLSFRDADPQLQLKLRQYGIWANHNTGPMDFPSRDKPVILDEILAKYDAAGVTPDEDQVVARTQFPRSLVRQRIAYRAQVARARARMAKRIEQAEGPGATVTVNPDGTVESVVREPAIASVNPPAVAELMQLDDERAALLEPVFVEIDQRRKEAGNGKVGRPTGGMSKEDARTIVRDIKTANADELPMKIALHRQQLGTQGAPGSNQLRAALTSTRLGNKDMSLLAAIDYIERLIDSDPNGCVERNPDAYEGHFTKVRDAHDRLTRLLTKLQRITDEQKKLIAADAQSVIDDVVTN